MATCVHIESMLGSISHIPDSFPVMLAIEYTDMGLEFSCLMDELSWNEYVTIYYKKEKGSSQSNKVQSSQMWI